VFLHDSEDVVFSVFAICHVGYSWNVFSISFNDSLERLVRAVKSALYRDVALLSLQVSLEPKEWPTMEEYQILKKKLDVPDNLMSILTRLISCEESRVLVLSTEKFLTASTVAEELGEKNVEKISSMLKVLYQKGFLYRKTIDDEEAYRCKSFYDIIRSHLEEHRYNALGIENLHMLRQYYISTRIRKTEKTIKNCQLEYSSKVIPIRKAIPATQYVLPTQQAIEFLKKAKLIALTKCGCRMAFRNCDNPVDTCIILDEEAEYLISRGYAKKISLEKSKNVLEIANRAGLVHLTLYLPGQKIYAICSCCPCCCHDLQALLKYGKKLFVTKSDYIAICDSDLCTGCGVCVERCIFNARKMIDGKSIVKEENCYGCGLCVTACPTNASGLILRKESSAVN
jgi:NAD-dependent dihydropyrimidine dehydrogenase PreA subunit